MYKSLVILVSLIDIYILYIFDFVYDKLPSDKSFHVEASRDVLFSALANLVISI